MVEKQEMQRDRSTRVISNKQERITGRDKWLDNLHIVTSVAEKIHSCFGPNGSYKMVAYNRGPEKIVKITKDGATILEELALQYPTLIILSEAAKMQRQEFGEGVNAFIILASSLLKKAAILSSRGLHPNLIVDGYSLAAERAQTIIDSVSETPTTNSRTEILKTLDCGKRVLTDSVCEMLDEAASRAFGDGVLRKEYIETYRKKENNFSDIRLIKGIVIEKPKATPNMPDSIENPRIALTSGRIGLNRVEVKMKGEGPQQMKLKITEPEQVNAYKTAIKELSLPALDRIEETGVNVVFCQQPMDNFVKSKLCLKGALAFEGVDQKDIKKLSQATGARILSNLAYLSKLDVGEAESLEMGKSGPKDIVILNGCQCGATFMLNGSTVQGLDEAENAIHDSIALMKTAAEDPRLVKGGGALEILLARNLQNFALEFDGRKQLAIDSFAESLLEIPSHLAHNYGLDDASVITELRKLHSEGLSSYGVGPQGCCNDVPVELAKVKAAVIRRACELVTLMLRIDEQIVTKEVPRFHKKLT